MYWYSQYFADAGYFFDEVVLKQLAQKRFLHERLLYLPKRLRKEDINSLKVPSTWG